MLTQGLAVDQFRSDIVIAINFSDLINSQNVWVIKSGSCLRFLDKAIQFVRVFAELIVQELDRDFAIEFRVLGEIDFTHAAGSDLGNDAVMRQGRIGGQFFIYRGISFAM